MKTKHLWLLWIALTVGLGFAASARLYVGGDRTAFLPGETSGVHHQFEVACETCHTSEPFEDQNSIRKDLNKTCVTCHKDDLKEANDSHPVKKFKNPRMAAYWDRIDARFCTSCHSEHEPEITLAGLLTLPGDLCVACHSEGEQDVRVNRPTHEGLTFDTCASSGCHNFHDNRALYEDFLVKHAGQPWLAPEPVHPPAVLARARLRPDADALAGYLAAVVAPEVAQGTQADTHWAASAHAAADVGCGGCHAPEAETPAEIEAAWIDAPEEAVCTDCHRGQAKTFALGRHGMRGHPEIARPRNTERMLKRLGWDDPAEGVVTALEAYLGDTAPPPLMSTSEARVDLHPEALGRHVTCSTCHAPHEQDLQVASVGACLTCHSDDHSQAYQDSPHHDLVLAERAGDLPPGSGVTCATCHMPQAERRGVVSTNHNQNDTLRPNEKMIRPVCMSCHSLEFSIDALADADLVRRNFSGEPDRHVESIDWAVNRVDRPDEGANQ
ncbi:cytochrome c3 family protein [Jannaschia sp. M317]|uniref:cytochrome c3 family protein n=1 Tax=Jannaschia sp. M317 TaxID=2867011 RepID=UPI0021A6285F|nr:cytochrome c3 family protein [Jannaschia sp. M317]UWQ16815.1 cytochrome c3 family protein [Jannaschia sp. M317]